MVEEISSASYFKKTGDSLIVRPAIQMEKIMASRKKGTFASASAALTKAMRNMEAAMASMVGNEKEDEKECQKEVQKVPPLKATRAVICRRGGGVRSPEVP